MTAQRTWLAPLAALLAGLPSSAQDAPPNVSPARATVVPAARSDDAIVARIANPARLRAALLSTTVGDLLGGDDGAAFRGQFAGVFEQLLDSLDPTAGQLLMTLAEAMGDDAGTWTLGLEVDSEALRAPGLPGALADAPLAGTLELQPGKTTDVEALRDRLDRLFRGSGAVVRELDHGAHGATVPYLSIAGHGVALPRLVDGRIRIDWGRPFPRAFAVRQREGTAWDPTDRALRRLPILVQMDLQRLTTQVETNLEPKVRDAYFRHLGITSLDRLQVSARANGPYLELQSELSFHEGAERGMFAGLFPATEDPPALVGLLPADRGAWQALPLDTARLWRGMIDGIAAYWTSKDQPYDRAVAELRSQERNFLGQNLDEGFLSHLQPHGLFLGSVDTESGSFVAAFRLDDAAAAERSWNQVMDRVGAFVPGERTEFEHGDHVIHAFDDLCRVFTDEIFVLAWGDGSIDEVRKVLDRHDALVAEQIPWTTLPPNVQRRVRQAPPGFHGCGSVGTDQLVGLEIATELLDLPDALAHALGSGWTEAMENVGPKLAEKGVERAISLSGWDADARTWRYRILW